MRIPNFIVNRQKMRDIAPHITREDIEQMLATAVANCNMSAQSYINLSEGFTKRHTYEILARKNSIDAIFEGIAKGDSLKEMAVVNLLCEFFEYIDSARFAELESIAFK